MYIWIWIGVFLFGVGMNMTACIFKMHIQEGTSVVGK